MSDISVSQLYELYLDTVSRCTSNLLDQSDEDIEYELFEEFDVGAHSFLHDENLAKLQVAGYLDEESVSLSRQMRIQWLKLGERQWTAEEIRTKKEWLDLFRLGDQLMERLTHHS